jgi:hypothetical protein
VILKEFRDSRTKDFAPASIVNDSSPLPERLTVDVLRSTLSPMVTLPVFEPFAVGVHVIFIRQLAPGASVVLLVQVVPEANAKFPFMLRSESTGGVVPEFVSVTDLLALVIPVS